MMLHIGGEENERENGMFVMQEEWHSGGGGLDDLMARAFILEGSYK